MLRRDFAKALIAAGVGVAAPSIAGEAEPLVLDDAQRISVKPGDVVVLTFAGRLTADQAARIRHSLEPVFPDNKVVVMSDGATFSVMTKEG